MTLKLEKHLVGLRARIGFELEGFGTWGVRDLSLTWFSIGVPVMHQRMCTLAPICSQALASIFASFGDTRFLRNCA